MTAPSTLPPDSEVAPARAAGTRLERGLLAFFLLAMVALPAASTVSRRFTGRELPGSAVLAQHITLWVGFLGALLATASGHHLALSTIELVPAGRPRRMARFFTQAVSAAACALLAWASARLVAVEWRGFGTVAFGIRVAWSELVMPIGFGFMALRFAWRAGDGAGAERWATRAAAFALAASAFVLGAVEPGPTLVWILLAIVLAAFLLGAPVFVAMSGVAMALFFRDGGSEAIAAVPTATFNLVSSATLPAIPLLTAAGYVLAEGGAAQRLVRAYKGIFGWMPGGVAIMATFVCALFTTFTGASGVTILALGGLLLPALRREGYPEDFSVGLVTASGSLGLLFPPSLPVILYGVVAQAPIDHLFLGGLVPGLLMIVIVAAYGVAVGIRSHAPRERFEPREAAAALWAAKWDLGLPTLVVVSVATGFATIVEAAALAAAYSIVVELFIFRSIHPLRDLPRVLVDAAALVGSVLILLGTALGLTSWFVDAEIPTRLVEWMTATVKSPALFLLMLNAVLLVLGSVLEIYSAIVVLAPLVAPLGAAYGIEPIHLGVVFLANLELGFLFPPMGLNLFLAASRFGKPLPYMYRKAFPFLLIMAAGVLAITYLPAITTGVVELLVGK
ncbi:MULTISPECIES: TRAP transporter large permease subunit [unclassified Anaeromyxobacter]|uniref:TRAP transporter large permease n=1 Tax=unclassified Anaeromyxobacter TaxID=2620896 RepID=UPI001F55DDDF|nr:MULTISPECIES: TRAP transporter large permease subunit [unclassified Anaeromyxobacter]